MTLLGLVWFGKQQILNMKLGFSSISLLATPHHPLPQNHKAALTFPSQHDRPGGSLRKRGPVRHQRTVCFLYQERQQKSLGLRVPSAVEAATSLAKERTGTACSGRRAT
ncbi:hypothetical protein HAX54_006159 [Datura stramonium]|uniref:Uncharacterized protein n=1 Tax=Datura stramonium TaxID=4076 RepID=A0ABS8WXI1_DATST|nr:hypothetical protein [Datura stramonium]